MSKIIKKNVIIKNNKIFILVIIISIVLIIVCVNLYKLKKTKEFFDSENIIYFLGENNVYMYFEDYINSFINKIPNSKLILYKTTNEIPEYNKNSKFVFIQTIPDSILNNFIEENKNVYLINTEQLTNQPDIEKINKLPKFIKIIDYSIGNLKYYNNFIYHPKFIEYQINMKEIYNFPKTNNICIMYGLSPYRKKIIDEIRAKNYQVDEISGWGQERDKKLFTYKILINISQTNNHKIMEPLRCNRCIFNKMIVISEKKEDEKYYSLKNYVIFEDYENLANKVIEVYNNYEFYYNKLGLNNLDLENLPINKNVNLE